LAFQKFKKKTKKLTNHLFNDNILSSIILIFIIYLLLSTDAQKSWIILVIQKSSSQMFQNHLVGLKITEW